MIGYNRFKVQQIPSPKKKVKIKAKLLSFVFKHGWLVTMNCVSLKVTNNKLNFYVKNVGEDMMSNTKVRIIRITFNNVHTKRSLHLRKIRVIYIYEDMTIHLTILSSYPQGHNFKKKK